MNAQVAPLALTFDPATVDMMARGRIQQHCPLVATASGPWHEMELTRAENLERVNDALAWLEYRGEALDGFRVIRHPTYPSQISFDNVAGTDEKPDVHAWAPMRLQLRTPEGWRDVMRFSPEREPEIRRAVETFYGLLDGAVWCIQRPGGHRELLAAVDRNGEPRELPDDIKHAVDALSFSAAVPESRL